MLKNELKYQKELQYQRQTSKKMFADDKSRHSPEKESYPWKYKTPEEIQWEGTYMTDSLIVQSLCVEREENESLQSKRG